MTNPKHTSSDLVERLRGDWPEILVEKHWTMDSDAIDKQREEAADRIEALEAEVERLASFIMHCIEGEPSQSQGAVDTAIRIMTEQATTIGEQLAENERLREALNPTNRRQAEYMNLFHWSEPDFDECGGRTTRHVSMPWPRIKQALAEIYARAALKEDTRHD